MEPQELSYQVEVIQHPPITTMTQE